MSDIDPRPPQWWSDHIAAAWQRSRDAALDNWRILGDHSIPVDASILERALAFGHGARSAYPNHDMWDTVSQQLRADWIRLGNTGPASWDQVAPIIRHEWRRAAGPGGDAPPDPQVAERMREYESALAGTTH